MSALVSGLICNATLLDLDGVLVRSGGAIERSWRQWALQRDLDPAAVIRQCHGRPSAATIAAVAPDLDAKKEAAILELSQAMDTSELEMCDGADRFVEALEGARWAIVTSGSRPLATARLRGAGLQVPNVLITADDIVHGKPSPEGYLVAAARLGVAPKDCVVVEDSRAGLLAARAAGAKVIGIAGSALGPTDAADLVVESLAELNVVNCDGVLNLRRVDAGGNAC